MKVGQLERRLPLAEIVIPEKEEDPAACSLARRDYSNPASEGDPGRDR